jgi:hypothetical protein
MVYNFEGEILKKWKVKQISCIQLVKSLKLQWPNFLCMLIKFISCVEQTTFSSPEQTLSAQEDLEMWG